MPFKSTEISVSGRPLLVEDEIELRTYSGAEVSIERPNDVKEHHLNRGTLIITNYRILHINESSRGHESSLATIKQVDDCSTFFSRSKRVKLLSDEIYHIRFNDGGKEEFMQLINEQLKKKAWTRKRANVVAQVNESSTITTTTTTTTTITHSQRAGISGIIKRQEQDLSSMASMTKEAMSDLGSLMNRAKDVVDIIQKYATYLEARSGKDDSETVVGEMNEIEEIFQSIGIISPVTKLSAGRLYHQQLARQINDILIEKQRLHKLGGIITLSDLYCLLNYSRGTELISPSDLLAACEQINRLDLPLLWKRYDSGVLVVHLRELSDEWFQNNLLIFMSQIDPNNRKGLQIAEIAQQFTISISVAKELVLEAEKRGSICRDDHVNGLSFFVNVF